MKINAFIPFQNDKQVAKTLAGLQQSDTIQNVFLLNRASKYRTVFTVGFLVSRSSKLDLTLIGYNVETGGKTKKGNPKNEIHNQYRKYNFAGQ